MADVARDVTIGMLGPLEVRVGFGEPVEVVGPRLRTLVIRLALDQVVGHGAYWRFAPFVPNANCFLTG